MVASKNALRAMLAFEFGFHSERLRMPRYYLGVEFPHTIQEAFDTIADEVRPNSFSILHRILAQLQGSEFDLFRAPETPALFNVLTSYPENSAPPSDDRLLRLDNEVGRWRDLATRFSDVAGGCLAEASPFQRWLNFGRCLGWYAAIYADEGFRPDSLDKLQVAVRLAERFFRQISLDGRFLQFRLP